MDDDGCGGPKILVAEDNEANRALMMDALEMFGFVPAVASNGQEAVQATLEQEFDLVLMDCRMPLMDGFEATEAIRKREADTQGRRVPIIALTANAMSGDKERCLEAGMDDYLAKPIDLMDLKAALERLIQ